MGRQLLQAVRVAGVPVRHPVSRDTHVPHVRGRHVEPEQVQGRRQLSGWVLDNFTGLLLASVMLIGIVMAANSVAKKLFGGE